MDDPRVQQLLNQLLDSQATPEEVCDTCPELLPEVRDRWLQMRRLRDDLDALFPPPDEPTPQSLDATPLPQIPGYEVEAVIGRGGMGIVFRARHLRLNRLVALKMLLGGAYAGPQDLARFQREAEAVAGLRHPNVVQVYDVGEHDGRPYFTMELIEGGSLSQKLAGTPQPARQAAQLVATLAEAVQAAHACGIVHRDLKPANVLLTADGTPKVTDFGLAKWQGQDGLTATHEVAGTPSYMAPEQARGLKQEVGPLSDVYALGAVLYECLTGRPPFKAETPLETMAQLVAEEPVPPSQLNANVPRDLETICLKCLRKEPPQRYPSALALADDVRRFLNGQPIVARPVGRFERAVKWARRRPAVALLVGALLVMLGAAAGAGVWLRQQEANRQAAKAQREGQALEALETALRRTDDLRREERWPEALLVLTDASPHLAEANSPGLEERFRQTQSDFRIADILQQVRESDPLTSYNEVDYQQRAKEYQTAFDEVGLTIADDAQPVVDYIRASLIGDQLVAAVEDRAFVAFMVRDDPLVERLLKIARLADAGSPWRDRFRDPSIWRNRAQLQELAAAAFTSVPPPSEHQLALLGLLLRQTGAQGSCTHLLGEACRRQPKNFWVHREMGFALLKEWRNWEAIAYYRAALAIRPDSAAVHERLGMGLSRANRSDEALAAYRRATELSNNISFRRFLVNALADSGYWKEAEEECRRTRGIDSQRIHPYFDLGNVLVKHERYEDAVVMYRRATENRADSVYLYEAFGKALAQTGRHEEAIAPLRKVAESSPANATAPQMLAHELAAVGRWEEAVTVLQAAAARWPNAFVFPFELGKLLRSHGKPEEATKVLRPVVTQSPQLEFLWEELADSLLDQGRFAEARATVESHLARRMADVPRRAQRRRLDLCNAMLAVEANLPAILAGKEQPADVPTQHALAEWCLKHKRLTATAADFYASALATQPSLADDMEARNRQHAARAAALAGCGVGADAAQLDDRRRAELRKKALDWLTAEYNAWSERRRLGKPQDRWVAVKAVGAWQVDEDLAGVRDEQALTRLSADERQDWQALWAKVASLAESDPAALFAKARAHVARAEWAKAAGYYASGIELEPKDDGDLWFEYAASQLLAGDRPGYRKTCAHMLTRCQPTGPIARYLVARACTLAPDWTDEPMRPLPVSPGELDRNKGDSWAVTTQAALYYRTKMPKEAARYAENSLVADGRPGPAVLNWLWLALAHQEMGSPNEARRWLDKAADWLDQQDGRVPLVTLATGMRLHNWLEAHVLRQEAEARLR
jgi:serine/threonine-protein kinase